ncbi:MAG: S-layer homology domain-containing protein [Clostridia bacterium]|nr:S-layer homology domain-containing protein [Clostridia bacterium]
MKKVLSLIMVLAMILTMAPVSAFAADNVVSFTDINNYHYCTKAATALGQLGILKGYVDGSFGPDKTITRAEMATVVCRMIQREEDAEYTVGKTDFKDVKEDHWASGFINIAARHKIINGYGNSEFRPENQVNFEEAVKMVVCALGYEKGFEADPNDWTAMYFEAAEKNGILVNLKGNKWQPATRADVAVMVYNAMNTQSMHSKIPAIPTTSVEAGKIKSGTKVKVTSVTVGAEIHYTLDGSIPTVNSPKYVTPLVIKEPTVIKALAVKNGVVSSDIMTVEYTIK